MAFTVPTQPAPFPSNLGGTGQTYYGTDWGRLGSPRGGPNGQWKIIPRINGGADVEWLGWTAQAPGYTQVLPQSTYVPWWRGAAFGPQGRGIAQRPWAAQPTQPWSPGPPPPPGEPTAPPPGPTWAPPPPPGEPPGMESMPGEPIITYIPQPKPLGESGGGRVKNPWPPPPTETGSAQMPSITAYAPTRKVMNPLVKNPWG